MLVIEELSLYLNTLSETKVWETDHAKAILLLSGSLFVSAID
jgi:hypothetical protein